MSANPITRNEAARLIAEFLRKETNFKDPALIHENTRLFDLGIVDSLMIVSLVAYCETTFGCLLPPDRLTEENLASPLALAALVVP
jgi:acyl carrier protein